MFASPRALSFDVSLRAESKLTVRSQTTIPTSVRDALKLKPGEDHIQYEILTGGQVLISRQQDKAEQDPVIEHFLNFLVNDMAANPHHIEPLSASLMQSAMELTANVEVDLDGPLTGEDDE